MRHRHTKPHGPANAGLDALLGRGAPPGSAAWRQSHARKAALTFCAALREARGMAVGSVMRTDPLNVYPCRHGDTPPDPLLPHLALQEGAQHWHVGHLRHLRVGEHTQPPGLTLAPHDPA